MVTFRLPRDHVRRNGLQDIGSHSFYKNGVITKPAEWPDNYVPFNFFEGFCTGFEYDPNESDEHDPYRARTTRTPLTAANHTYNGKTRGRPNGGSADSYGRATDRRLDSRRLSGQSDEHSRTKTPGNKKYNKKQEQSRQPTQRGRFASGSGKENSNYASNYGGPFSSRLYGVNGRSTQMTSKPKKPVEFSFADPVMLPYSTVYYPSGPCGPRMHICPYVPLCCC